MRNYITFINLFFKKFGNCFGNFLNNKCFFINVRTTLKYILWTILILSGLGILTTSSIGIFNKNHKTKLINYPIIKWLLILGFILGLTLILLGIIFIAL